MEPRISIITLGVDDLDRAAAFYGAMGLERNARFADGVAFYQMGGLVLALWRRSELVRDAGIEGGAAGFSGVALAYNTRTEAEVAEMLDRVERAGGTVVKPASPAFWDGMQGYFRDTEGHLWEVAHNRDFPLDAAGNIALPD